MEYKLKATLKYVKGDSIITITSIKSKRATNGDEFLQIKKEIRQAIRFQCAPLEDSQMQDNFLITIKEEKWSEIGVRLISEETRYYYSLEAFLDNE